MQKGSGQKFFDRNIKGSLFGDKKKSKGKQNCGKKKKLPRRVS
jgi:hypothetical protein